MPSAPKADNRDPVYFRHCQDLCRSFRGQCFVTGDHTGLVPHHVLPKGVNGDLGMDLKGNIVLLTQWLHYLSNDSAHALGHYTLFDEAHGVDSLAEAHRLRALYLETGGE